MRGEPPPPGPTRRYWKFGWNDLGALPAVGTMDYQPKDGAFRMFREGVFFGERLQAFPAKKERKSLSSVGLCIYCGRDRDSNDKPLQLTSEHIVPEFLGAGLELPEASCADCQKLTSKFESAIASEMFDPVRKSFALEGKNGVLQKSNFPLDVGRESTTHEFIPLIHYPTILVLPNLYPASSYSDRPESCDDPFNFLMFNINADSDILHKYALDKFSSQIVDLVRFSQLIAKISHCSAVAQFGYGSFTPVLTELIRQDFPTQVFSTRHFAHVGCLWQMENKKSENLHEIEIGRILWRGITKKAVRVRLFAICDMPSYYVTVE